MAIYFFALVIVTVVSLFVFCLSESKGRNSPHARGKKIPQGKLFKRAQQ
jgi:hypothetical protein